MNVVSSTRELKPGIRSVITVGTFDGVHKGHREILRRLLEKAGQRGGRSIVVTFDPHPKEIVGKGGVGLLTTLDERLSILEEIGIDSVLVLKFDYQFSRQSSREFYRDCILPNTEVTDVIVGYDHSFGRDRSSTIQDLENLGNDYHFKVEVVPPASIGGDVVSSTKIRKLLAGGMVEEASRYLDGEYFLTGTVIRGDRRGLTLGFPTANIRLSSELKLLPKDGVYCVSVRVGRSNFRGMMNIGFRPTFQGRGEKYLEVNLFGFDGDLYDNDLKISFLKWVREEKYFKTKEDLITQLQRDRSECQSHAAVSLSN